MQPKVSIVMPVYNAEHYIGEALDSILKQTFSAFECIIVDDGSTDKTAAIIQNYANQDKRIRIIHHVKNLGIAQARNNGIQHSRTNIIIHHDADDKSKPQRIKTLYKFHQNNPEYVRIGGAKEIIDPKGKHIGYRVFPEDISSYILQKNPLSQPTSLMRKDAREKVGGYNSDYSVGEDYELLLKMYAKGEKITNIPEILIEYRWNPYQSKSNKLKETLRITIQLQKRATTTLKIPATRKDRGYQVLEKILLLLPSKRILILFKQITYKQW